MISIEKYSAEKAHLIHALSVTPEQAQFTVDNIGEMIPELKESEHPYVIMKGAQPAGFFLLDIGYADKFSFCPEDGIGIRALLIDRNLQGQGIARDALKLLPQYVGEVYPQVSSLYLTVNCRNEPAYRCYLSSGFTDTDELYLGGPVGPQHIMMTPVCGRG
ncbi:GNAT family N-acetyltransferase [Vibrio coralliilyticus]|uniref:GNAT family N-acetyltransferase n=1 Tax=Vibrio coralliilyticus TaxID=190893 RepID=UPI000BAC1616|nr:GNAT family N-acetyltransferase [Vibrio coralliilyticus]NOI75377.1 GNAT family N-acetyltransferase [Vibrio coralliilyticus]PAW04206.1 GNAT family N-acetyltransferase [Vibrio coralliilyticus]